MGNDKRYIWQVFGKSKQRSKRFMLAAGAIFVAIIVGIFAWIRHEMNVAALAQQEEIMRIETENRRRIEAERERLDSINAIETLRQQRVADSIRIANMPTYSLDDVRKMVTANAPSYSWIYLWRKDKDNWIMRYMREYGGKEHWFMQRFNPTISKFEKPIEYSTVYYRDAEDNVVYSQPHNVRCSFTENNVWGTLDYTEDGIRYGRYSRKDIESICRLPSTTVSPLAKKRIKELNTAPPDWADDGYESAEDYFYDNAEDLYNYYGR